ncbi:MAG: GntR family transcriptional regulator [Desulfobacterales bacterium]|nr:GntR family transcriptional regulator [Desulfobacterales bacterium]
MNKEIYSLVRDRILSMEYKPGKILNEQKLAKEFGVSRTPLREALTKLEWEKLVRVLPRTGSMVTEIEFQKMVNVFQIRFELEDLAGRLAAENVTEEHLDQLLTLKKGCEQMKDEIDHTTLATIDKKLRKIVYHAADNDMLTEISDFLYSLTQRLWSLMFKRGNWKGELQAIIHEMDLTHKVLSEGDPVKAGAARRRLLDEHVQRIKGNF